MKMDVTGRVGFHVGGLLRMNSFLAATFLVSLTVVVSALAQNSSTYQGFGAETRGGEGQPLYRVTNLNDSGAGSLRDAISQGNRYVVFDVAGEINLANRLRIKGANLTIDGCTAPSPGITLKGWGLEIRGNLGAHDIIVQCLRSRDSAGDGFTISEGAFNIVLDRLSSANAGDGAIDITSWNNQDVHDITVQWSILAQPRKNMLIKYPDVRRITLHHNLFVGSTDRNPRIGYNPSSGTPADEITADMRNNVVANWGGGMGTNVECGAKANIVANYYSSPASGDNDQLQAIWVFTDDNPKEECGRAFAYVQDNLSGDVPDIDNSPYVSHNEISPFPAPAIITQDACTAAHHVLSGAGVRPLDWIDQEAVSAVLLQDCPDNNTAPNADAGPDQTTTVGETLSFDGSGSSDPDGDPLTYLWDFGDGDAASGVVATHAYETAGDYTVTLIVSDGDLSATDIAQATITPASPSPPPPNSSPVANAGPDQTVLLGEEATLDGTASSDPDGDSLIYNWDFGDGTAGSGPVATHIYPTAETYTATLTVSDGALSATDTALVTVSETPESANDLVVDIVSPSSYEVAQLVEGDRYYIDRSYVLTDVPSAFEGLTWVRTANNDKKESSESFLTFTVNRDVKVYVAYDRRADSLPNWLSNFIPVGQSIGVSDSAEFLDLYVLDLAAGTITLGGNLAAGADGARSNYVALMKPEP